jgi:PKD repeat protein
VNEGKTADQVLNAVDADDEALTFSLVSGPTYATVTTTNATTGNIHVAPGFGDAGTATAVVGASDGTLSDQKTFNITVNNINLPPVISAPLSVSTFEGSTVSFSVSGSDPDGDSITLAVLSPPVGATFVDNGGGSGGFTWTPGFDQAGTHSVSFIARDNQGGSSVPKAVTIEVRDRNRPPTSSAGGPYSGVVNVPITFNGTGSSDPDGSPLTYSWTFGDGMTSAGPMPEHAYATGGTFTVVLTVSDGLLTDNASSIATIQDTFPGRAFTTNGYGTIRLGSGKATWCVQIEPVNGSYITTAVVPSSVTMKYGTSQIYAMAGKAGIGADKDGNRILELTSCFSKVDLRSLFTDLPKGTNTVTATLEGDLSTGGKFRATLTVDVVSTGGGVAASVSPNPLNPEAILSFTISKPGRVRVSVFCLDGRLARTLLDGAVFENGRHDLRIDGQSNTGARLASGVYFYRIEAPEGATTGRFAVMK